jgi:phosphoglycolate phosphatase
MSDWFDFWLLDLDGTLVDTENSYIQTVLTEVGDLLDVSFTAEQAEHLWYGFGDTRDRVLAEMGLGETEFWDAFHVADDPAARAQATHPYPDAEPFLKSLDGPVGLVTHCQEYLTYPVLDTLDMEEQFDTVVCCTDETGWKPDPTPLQLAMEDLNVNGGVGAMVGDDPGDVAAARNAGLTAISVARHDPDRVGTLARGDRHVRRLTELPPAQAIQSSDHL